MIHIVFLNVGVAWQQLRSVSVIQKFGPNLHSTLSNQWQARRGSIGRGVYSNHLTLGGGRSGNVRSDVDCKIGPSNVTGEELSRGLLLSNWARTDLLR